MMLEKQIEYIRSITDFIPDAAIVLGSGLGDFANEADIEAIINYEDIPGFPVSTAPSHKGRLIFGYIAGVKAVIMQGRVHYYEGYSASEIGRILGKKENTVYSLLSRGRGMLKEELGGERIHE